MSALINHKDPAFIRQLYKDYYKALVLYGMKILNEHQAASEDIVQDVFSLFWRKDLTFDNPVQLKVYLYNSVRNNCLDYLKHCHVEKAYLEKVQRDYPYFYIDTNKEEGPFGEEIYRELFKVIEQLPPRRREIFLMVMDGKTNREIAEALHISENTVKTQTRRATDFLKDHLTQESWLLISLIFNFY